VPLPPLRPTDRGRRCLDARHRLRKLPGVSTLADGAQELTYVCTKGGCALEGQLVATRAVRS
jgi:hypothetical protein